MRDNTARIIAEGVSISNDTWETGLNNNDIIVGPSGAGKTRGYLVPALATAQSSLIVTDTKGMLHRRYAGSLSERGYKIQLLDLTDCAHSPVGYNPLDFIGCSDDGTLDEQAALRVATALCPIEDPAQPFWDMAAKGLLSSLIGYVMEALPREEAHLGSVCRLYYAVLSDAYEELMDEMEVCCPNAFAVRQYAPSRAGKNADKMTASIQGILGEKLAMYASKTVERIFTLPERVDFAALRREKIALFVNQSDTDRSMDRLISLLYSQAIHALCNTPEIPGEPFLPVRMIMDDFASGCTVPEFDRVISVVRSRQLYLSVIIQSLSQLQGLYGADHAATILNNCDTMLYLGGTDVETARYIGTRANLPVHAVLDLPVDQALLFQRGQSVRRVRRYRPEEHGEEAAVSSSGEPAYA